MLSVVALAALASADESAREVCVAAMLRTNGAVPNLLSLLVPPDGSNANERAAMHAARVLGLVLSASGRLPVSLPTALIRDTVAALLRAASGGRAAETRVAALAAIADALAADAEEGMPNEQALDASSHVPPALPPALPPAVPPARPQAGAPLTSSLDDALTSASLENLVTCLVPPYRAPIDADGGDAAEVRAAVADGSSRMQTDADSASLVTGVPAAPKGAAKLVRHAAAACLALCRAGAAARFALYTSGALGPLLALCSALPAERRADCRPECAALLCTCLLASDAKVAPMAVVAGALPVLWAAVAAEGGGEASAASGSSERGERAQAAAAATSALRTLARRQQNLQGVRRHGVRAAQRLERLLATETAPEKRRSSLEAQTRVASLLAELCEQGGSAGGSAWRDDDCEREDAATAAVSDADVTATLYDL